MGEVTMNLQPFKIYQISPSNHKLFTFLVHAKYTHLLTRPPEISVYFDIKFRFEDQDLIS